MALAAAVFLCVAIETHFLAIGKSRGHSICRTSPDSDVSETLAQVTVRVHPGGTMTGQLDHWLLLGFHSGLSQWGRIL